MKKQFLFLLISLLCFSAYSQTAPKLSFNLALKIHKREFSQKPVSLLVQGDPARVRELVQQKGGTFKFAKGDISSVLLPLNAITNLTTDVSVKRIEEGATKVQLLMDDTMRYMNNIIDVHNGTTPLLQPYTGSNVVMGIIDTGIDFTHPDFQDSTGKTRIKFIWDHLLPDSVNTPLPYNYGQEFTEADINNGAAVAHHDQGVHGTVITGIAAGNGNAVGQFIGAAPNAELIVVSINFNISDDAFLSAIADAVDYIYAKADSMGKPCIINISAGTYYGSHDGLDLSTKMIDNLISAKNGRSLVCAAGNAGTFPLHVHTTITIGDTLFTWFKSPSFPYCEFWADSSHISNLSFTIGADRATPFYEFRGALPYTTIQQQLGSIQEDTLYSLDGNKLGIVYSYADLVDGQYGMFYQVAQDSMYNWRIQMTGAGKIDGYTFDWISSGLPSAMIYPAMDNYVYPDYDQNMCSGFQCSDKTITVAQYTNMNRYTDYNNNLQTFGTTTGAIHPTSSAGPTRDGRQKPDITASGEWTFGPLIVNSQPWFIANEPFKIPPTAQHLRGNGTSSASAVVSGVAALYFEAFPSASWQDVKNAVINCAKTDAFTGTNLPNNRWGYGKIDAFGMLTNCGITGINEAERKSGYIYSFPNPSATTVTLSFPELKKNGILYINDQQGRIVIEINLEKGMSNLVFHEKTLLTPGLYLARIISGGEILSVGKLLRQ